MVDEHRDAFGVEPICRTLGIAPSTYYAVKARQASPSERAVRDEQLAARIRAVHAKNLGVYGVRKVWWQLAREDVKVARCTVERLMAREGLKGAIRGKKRAPRSQTGNRPGRRTSLIVISKRAPRTACGYRISRMCRPGPVRSMSRSRSTCSPVGSSAGRPTRR